MVDTRSSVIREVREFELKQCPACGANNASDLPSCSICGASLSQVAESGAPRTLFGMPALKIDQAEVAEKPAPAAPAPEPDRSQGPATKRGFRALDAVELDGSIGSMNAGSLDGSDIRSTQFGAPSPFKKGQLPPLAADEPLAPPGAASDPAPAADPILSTQFGAPSPFKAGRHAAAEPAPEPEGAGIESTRMGMPSVDVHGGASEPPAADPPAPEAPQENYRTLVGPPLPVAEAARARDAARDAIAEAPQESYRTLVGPPVPIAEAARARDARRRAEAEAAASARSSKPSVIVDDPSLERKEADSAPSVIVDEPVTARSSTREAGAAARIARPPGATEVASDGDERAAAARLAAVIDTDEHTAMVVAVQPRSYGWLVFLVLVIAGIALALWLTREAQAVEARVGAVEVEPAGERLAFAVDLETARPLLVGHPGGQHAVDGPGRVEFDLDGAALRPGVGQIALRLGDGDPPVELPLELTVWYRARVEPVEAVGAPVPVELTVRPGWQPVGDAVEPVAGDIGRHRLLIDGRRALAEVDAPGGLTAPLTETVRLRGDGGAEAEFALTVQVPLPRTPLVVTAPPRAWRRDAEAVTVAGRTVPEAEVRVGEHAAQADADGRFSLVVPLSGAREQALEVVADAPGARATVQRITVERLTPEAGRTQAAALRAEQAERLGPTGRTPPYARWLADAEGLRGRAVAFEGRLIAVERGGEGPGAADRAVIAACDRGDHCPVWITTTAPILVDPGQRVSVSGTLAGAETWRTADRFVTAPRVEGALIAP